MHCALSSNSADPETLPFVFAAYSLAVTNVCVYPSFICPL